MTKELLLMVGLLLYAYVVESKDLLEEIKSKPALSEAAKIIESDKTLKVVLKTRSYMAFLPNNDALNAYNTTKDAKLIRYHLSNLPYLVQEMPDELNTDLQGNPRVYVSKMPSGAPSIRGWEDYEIYINDAKIIDANYEAETRDEQKQMLHIVDKVITPTLPRKANFTNIPPEYRNPDAQKLLLKPHFYGLEKQLSISMFENRVSNLELLDVFSMSGKNTFFIPVDKALNVLRNEQDLIDKQVVHGHVVPGKVLFTRTVRDSKKEYESMAFIDNLKVLISVESVGDSKTPGNNTYYVKSKTISGDISHKKGTVIARIVKGNIPVKNGVVHLIDRPLMVVATNIISYLQAEHGQLTEFYNLIRNHNEHLSNKLTVGQSLTLFAPSNKAFSMVNINRFNLVQQNQDKISKLLKLHIVERRLTTDEIIDGTTKEVPTLTSGRKLYFAVNHSGTSVPIVTLEGAGVNATITTQDIATRNGVVHIIDRILGIPSQTVYEKLATDPMLSSTFNLSEQEGWNERLMERDERYTLFVPSNNAWEEIHRTMPSAYKKLFMGAFAYHVRYILERHMIVGESYSLDDLLSLTTNATVSGKDIRQFRLDMTRGKVYFQARVRKSYGNYYTEWNGVRARVIRPDVECVNGVVHVIDKVMMMNRDVSVSGSAVPAVTGLATLIATFFTVAFARTLHH